MIHKLSALPAAALALLLLSSCEATPLQGGEEDGDVITFSAVTGYDSSSTKTAYSGETSGTPAKERIDWMAGDRFKLVCAQATPSSSDYEIDATGITADGAKSRATKIVPVPTGTFPNGTPKANGLKWGTDWPHQFYAVYPSTASLSTSGQITATIPASQSPRATDPTTSTTSGGKTNTRVHPDMNNCMMWSGTSVASKGKFTLRFTPMVTTFQFTVGGDGTGAGDITISSVELLSSSVALCGGLTAQVTGTGATAEIAQRGGSVSYTLPSSGTGSSVTFTLPANTKINDTQSLTFTLFVYPTGRTVGGEDILDGLTVKYNTSVGARSLALKYSTSAQTNPGQYVQFPAGRKINIENLQLPAQLEYWRYSITIGNHEEEISDVAVNPVQVEEWDEEDYPYVLDEVTKSMSYIIQTDAGHRSLTLPLAANPVRLKVNWGDNNEDDYPAGTSLGAISHTYDASYDGKPTPVTITSYGSGPEGEIEYGDALNYPDFQYLLKELTTPLLYSAGGIRNDLFNGCANLTTLCEDLFVNFPNTTILSRTFAGCSSLREIPPGLFAGMKQLKHLSFTFDNCTSLTKIPSSLFADTEALQMKFEYTFQNCTSLYDIGGSLFAGKNVASFNSTFSRCTSLEDIPDGLFTSISGTKIDFVSTFYRCNKLLAIPPGLFSNLDVNRFNYTFAFCEKITDIPPDLFSSNPGVTSFQGVFNFCTGIDVIPRRLFANNYNVEDFGYAFYNLNISEVDVSLFAASGDKVKSFERTFAECSSLTSVPENLFASNTNATNFKGTFATSGLKTIPAGLFAKNFSATSFEATFQGCNQLTGIPGNLFMSNTSVTTFKNTFWACGSLTGSAPALWTSHSSADGSGCFYNCSGLSNYSAIPAGWK